MIPTLAGGLPGATITINTRVNIPRSLHDPSGTAGTQHSSAGTSGADVNCGLGGADTADGKGGGDTIYGDIPNDSLAVPS